MSAPKLVQLELPMSWPPPYVPTHGVKLALGGYARGVRCAREHHGRGFLYVSAAGEHAFECGNCSRLYPAELVRDRQQGALGLEKRR